MPVTMQNGLVARPPLGQCDYGGQGEIGDNVSYLQLVLSGNATELVRFTCYSEELGAVRGICFAAYHSYSLPAI